MHPISDVKLLPFENIKWLLLLTKYVFCFFFSLLNLKINNNPKTEGKNCHLHETMNLCHIKWQNFYKSKRKKSENFISRRKKNLPIDNGLLRTGAWNGIQHLSTGRAYWLFSLFFLSSRRGYFHLFFTQNVKSRANLRDLRFKVDLFMRPQIFMKFEFFTSQN